MKKWYDGRLNDRAKAMRKSMTPEEKILWRYLRNRPEHFYRQRAIGPFIADFYSSRLKLAIEADGIQHETEDGKLYDTERGALFEKFGVQILRFSNREISEDFQAVRTRIEDKMQTCKEE